MLLDDFKFEEKMKLSFSPYPTFLNRSTKKKELTASDFSNVIR